MKLISEIDLFVPHPHIEDEPQGNHVGNDGRTAVADEGQGDSGDRHDSHGHGDILKNLETEHTNEANGNQGAVELLGCPGYFYDAVQEEGIKADEGQSSQHAQFLHNDGKNEVGLLDWQELQLLLSPHEETLAEEATGTDGHFAVPNLIIAWQRQVIRMEKSINSNFLVLGHESVNDGNG